MDKKATPEMASDFIKYLVELTNYGFVKEGTNEILDIHGEPITVSTPSGEKPLMVFGPKIIADDHVILNIFVDDNTEGSQVTWFWASQLGILGTITKEIILNAITYKSKNDDSDFICMELAHILKGDAKMQRDFDKIAIEDLITIFYQKESKKDPKKNKTAQLQTKLFDKAYMET